MIDFGPESEKGIGCRLCSQRKYWHEGKGKPASLGVNQEQKPQLLILVAAKWFVSTSQLRYVHTDFLGDKKKNTDLNPSGWRL